MAPSDFAAFILTHGRPKKVHTAKALAKHGYTGPVFIVIDDEDETRDEYVRRFGADRVLTFSKAEIAKEFDEGDNFADRRSVFYARNACWALAKRVGVRYFIQLDDDYNDFRYKVDGEGNYVHRASILDLDRVLCLLLEYFKSIPALSIAMAQGGDFMGGKKGSLAVDGWRLKRKCMNTFICDTERPFEFVGRINEDVNTYTSVARRGGLFATVTMLAIQQAATQQSSGGMTELYLDAGTYVKSFYSVMYAPSCVRIGELGSKARRLHHQIAWRHTVPLILDEAYCKRIALGTSPTRAALESKAEV